MKKFVREVGLYLGIIAIIFVGNYLYNSYQITHTEPLPKAETIILGDSRMMTGMNPNYITSSHNYAQNSENYFVSFHKLKFILNHVSGIENIIMGFSYPNFSAYQDNYCFDDAATSDILNRIYPIIKLSDFNSIKVNKEKYNLTYFRNMFVYPHKNHLPFLGSYQPLSHSKNYLNYISIIQRHYFNKDSVNIGISLQSANYLDSIQHLTQEKNVRLILVNLPLYNNYERSVPENFKTYYQTEKTKIMQHQNVLFLDYGLDECPANYFKDAVHLSNIGADVYSKKLNNILKSKQ